MTLEQLEETVAKLPPEQLARFREWFREFDAELFDEKIANDSTAGRLDELANAAIADHQAGRSKPL